jgi:4-diphosphocytidyl-2-C-methyl-D-erythritol kinase
LCNDLETVVIPRYPEIATAKKRLLENGAQGALMSGSGSSVFGMFAKSKTARVAGEVLSPQYGGAVFVVDLLV